MRYVGQAPGLGRTPGPPQAFIVMVNGDRLSGRIQRLDDSRIFTGAIVNAKDGMRLQDSNSSEVVPRDSIVKLRSFQEQIDYQRMEERKLAPRLLDPWTGFVDAGVSVARGNAGVTTYSVNGNGVRTRAANRTPYATTTANVRRGDVFAGVTANREAFATGLSWQVSVSNRYSSDPVTGAVPNDVSSPRDCASRSFLRNRPL